MSGNEIQLTVCSKPIDANVLRRMAQAGLAELCDWDHPGLSVCELSEEVMIRAYIAMVDVAETQATEHLPPPITEHLPPPITVAEVAGQIRTDR
jgi:hypothetical protein